MEDVLLVVYLITSVILNIVLVFGVFRHFHLTSQCMVKAEDDV